MTPKHVLQLFALFSLAWNTAIPNASADEKRLSKEDREVYRSIAHRIVAKLIDSERRAYPDLAQLSAGAGGPQSARFREEAEDKLWIAYHYSHGLSWIANLNHKPLAKGGAKSKSFSDDGVELNLYFYEGDWMGQATVSPLEIGRMKIVVFVEGSRAPRKAFGEAIRRAIEREQSAFQKKSPHGASYEQN